ncbi:MAG: polysaccharide deacetylase family protein [Gammaproteobacteria bacterium]|nr:polysaccharide deacetylase family protein [Gammaproteobacteria bacterium]
MPIPILMYHQIDNPPARGTPMRGLVVSPRRFAAQMRLLSRMGYRGLSMSELVPYLNGERQGKVVGITFDDGYRNTLEHALPILKAEGFTATCYAVSRKLGGFNDWDAALGVPQKPLMTAAELAAWVAAGMEVGAHTRHHVDLSALPDEEAQTEIRQSRSELERVIQAPVRHFCYPYGRFRPEHVNMVRTAGFATAVTVRRGRVTEADDLFQLSRVLVAQATHLAQFALKLWTNYEDRRERR